MGRIRDLINIFLKPSESERAFDELALAGGIKPKALKELKATQNGAIGWDWYSEEPKTAKNSGGIAGLKIPKLKANNPREQQNDSRTSEGQQPSGDGLEL